MEEGVFEKIAEICIDSEDNVVVNWFPEITRERMMKLLKKALEALGGEKMTKEEIKFQCLRVASDVLGVYPGAAAYTENAGNKPSVNEVLEKAKQIFDWVTNG